MLSGVWNMTDLPKCPKCGKGVMQFSFAGGTAWYHVDADGIPQPSSPACAPPAVGAMSPQEEAASRYEAIQSCLMPEANYHYNAMMSMQGLQQKDLPDADATILIQAAVAWSLLGLLRSKVREAS